MSLLDLQVSSVLAGLVLQAGSSVLLEQIKAAFFCRALGSKVPRGAEPSQRLLQQLLLSRVSVRNQDICLKAD